MNFGKKKIIAICVGTFVLGIAIGALTLLGFSNFNTETKKAESSTEQVQDANPEESKEQNSTNDQENTKTSEDSKKTEKSETKEDSKSNSNEVILVDENDGYTYKKILTFNGNKLLKLVLEVTSTEGKSLDSVKKEYEAADYKTLEYNKDFLKMESSKFTIDSLNKVGGKQDIINFISYD